MMQSLRKIPLGIMFLALSWFTYLQFNDPDAIFWIVIYASAALVPLLGLFNRRYLGVTLIVSLLCLAELMLSAQGAYTYWLHRYDEALMQSMNPEKPYIEEAREFLGSLIALGVVWSSHYLSPCKSSK
jgi:hypothetical protein